MQPFSLFQPGSTIPDDAQERKNLLGGKGAGLFEMTTMGVPVPKFIVIPTNACVAYMTDPVSVATAIDDAIDEIIGYFKDENTGAIPLLSVRSGARVSMPGMMDTILNVGSHTDDCEGYIEMLSARTSTDCRRRFLHMYGATAKGIPDSAFEAPMTDARKKANVDTDAELTDKQLDRVIEQFYDVYAAHKVPVPETLEEQLRGCIYSVMDSWNSPRAIEYRKHNNIPNDWGTAVVVQRMVFGNMDDDSGSGVLFSRDPQTGEDVLTGEFLPNAQGEDVVAGIRTPLPLKDMAVKWPNVFTELNATVCELEDKYGDMLDIEFTVESRKLYFLQVRTGKRSARAAVRICLDMAPEKLFDRVSRDQVRTLSQPVIDAGFKVEPNGTGLPACSGVVTGVAAFTPEQAVAFKASGTECILIRHETSPDDIAGMFAAVGILTATGGATSHAAVVARGMDKTCITGCPGLKVHSTGAVLNGASIGSDTKVTLDGATGRIWIDTDVPVSDPTADPVVAELTKRVFKDNASFQYFPGNNGTVYGLSQFLETVPAPTFEGNLVVLADAGVTVEDHVLQLTDGYSPQVCYERLGEWLTTNDRKAQLFVSKALGLKGKHPRIKLIDSDPSIKGMLSRPVARAEVMAIFGDEDTLNSLIAPATIGDKFNLFYCERHDLLAAFK